MCVDVDAGAGRDARPAGVGRRARLAAGRAARSRHRGDVRRADGARHGPEAAALRRPGHRGERRARCRTATRCRRVLAEAAAEPRARAAAAGLGRRAVPHARPLPARRGCRSWTCPRSTTPTCAKCCRGCARAAGRSTTCDGPTGSDGFQGRLTHAQRQAVEREAPERIEVPSGSRIALQVRGGPAAGAGGAHPGAVRAAPTRRGSPAGGCRCCCTCSRPNYRPQQVTDDLASFWANTYPVVRKELRARYPKHAWPEDPLTAAAQSRPRRR